MYRCRKHIVGELGELGELAGGGIAKVTREVIGKVAGVAEHLTEKVAEKTKGQIAGILIE